jgi:hypothetical protein
MLKPLQVIAALGAVAGIGLASGASARADELYTYTWIDTSGVVASPQAAAPTAVVPTQSVTAVVRTKIGEGIVANDQGRRRARLSATEGLTRAELRSLRKYDESRRAATVKVDKQAQQEAAAEAKAKAAEAKMKLDSASLVKETDNTSSSVNVKTSSSANGTATVSTATMPTTGYARSVGARNKAKAQ